MTPSAKGDVVQSGSDSTLGITSIDGTVFGLASNAKMVLNEMIYDPNGSDNKSLLGLVASTISFVAGATAKKGDMKVDTPVATMGIRGTAVLVEIDFEVPVQGGAPPAKFQVLVEPDGTTGSYILFDKTTLTPIATVSQAGTQTIINGQGAVGFQSSGATVARRAEDHQRRAFAEVHRPQQSEHQARRPTSPTRSFRKLLSSSWPATISARLRFSSSTSRTGRRPPRRRARRTQARCTFPARLLAAASGGALPNGADVTATPRVDSMSGTVNYVDINVGRYAERQCAVFFLRLSETRRAPMSTRTLTAEQLAAIKAVEVPLRVVQDPNGSRTPARRPGPTAVADGAFDFLAAGRNGDADLYGAGRQQPTRRATRRRSCRSYDRHHWHQRQADASPQPAARSPSGSAPAIRPSTP